MRLSRFVVVIYVLLIGLWVNWGNLRAQGGSTKVLDVEILSSLDKIPVGKSVPIAIKINVHTPWHINSVTPKEAFLVPTQLKLNTPEGVTLGRVRFPEAIPKKFEFSEKPLEVYQGVIYAYSTLTVSPDFKGTTISIDGEISYQACNDQICLPPETYVFEKILPVAQAGETPKAIHSDIFKNRKSEGKTQSTSLQGTESQLVRTIESKGMFVAFLVIFVSGLALNLTPCVYPLIPITVSYFGGQAGGKKGNLLMHAILYVLGMAFTYSILGVIAALTGSILGGWLQNPFVLLFIAAVMVALALSMFGVYEIRVPARLANFAGQSKQGYFGTLFMGLTVGIIAAPCIGPFVLALFTYVGEKANPVLGFWMFFVLAMGLGIPFIFLAMFSGALNRLPRSGAWMVWVRKIFGFILIAVALYFLDPLITNELFYFTAMAMVFILGGTYLAWIDPTSGSGKAFVYTRNLIGVLFIILGIYVWVQGIDAQIDVRVKNMIQSEGQHLTLKNEIAWKPYNEGLLQQAKNNHQPVFIDFYADWCIPCKELDKFTFTDPQVIKRSHNFVNLKADLTHFNNPDVEKLKKQYNIKGVPTLIFLDAEGKEIPGTRVVGFIKAEELVKIMDKVLAK